MGGEGGGGEILCILLIENAFYFLAGVVLEGGYMLPSHFGCETSREGYFINCAPMPSLSCRWYQRLWPRKKPPPPKTRRRASCTHCHTNHCLECKQLWHEGDCQKLSREEEKVLECCKGMVNSSWAARQNLGVVSLCVYLFSSFQAFPVNPANLPKSVWPNK